ncbi:cilia- and flagella-associated protein 65 [Hypomesus transpacificus]|uniref:cilia- and flagella-associated protein 65 n=1 Tax=Hypomesus transpacificus TaxID=137520 RepID=UPI001F07FE53|nr:cilia- and flagella-associated protein 65 [Hypomesus transpacificus]
MIANVPGNTLDSGTHWTTTCGKNAQVGPVLQRPGQLQRKAPSQRSCFLGVETLEELTWENWDLGGEFTKTLFLKNVHSKLQKLRFRPPVSKFFTTLFPQLIVLSPGMSYSLPVTFHPLDRCEYQDSIEFQSKNGLFQVCLRATIPRHTLEIPESVLLPPCAVHHSSQSTFLFRNASKLQTGFQWEVTTPFQLSPDRGVLGPGQECRVTVVFRPLEALVYQREASCAFGDDGETTCTVLLQGMSKYPFLEISAPGQEEGCKVLDFGSVAVKASVEKHFEILNKSSMRASFSLSRFKQPPLSQSEFQCLVEKGEVAGQSAVRVPVSFSPVAVDSSSVNYLSLTCPGALNKTLLKLTGSCIGPQVSLSSSVLDFGCVGEGEESLRSVDLVNTSSVEAHYQFDLDGEGHSVFSLQPAGGALPPYKRVIVKLLYRPSHPIAHHRRVACLLLHREPLFLDLIGTCHSEQLKPAIFKPKHLVVYQHHLARGLTQYPPDMLSAMLAEGKLQVDQQGALVLPEDLAMEPAGPETASVAVPARALTEKSPMEEYYQSCSGGKRHEGGRGEGPGSHVTLEPPKLMFHPGSTSLPVAITNHTKGKLSVLWTPAADSPFSVTPSSCDLGALKSTSFRVTYTPKQHNTFHGGQLECFSLYKVLSDHRHVEDSTICPSWCLTVRVIGHSFQPGREHFVPRLSLQPPQVVFPGLSMEFYRTVLLQNTGALPLIYTLDQEQSPSVCVFPSCGLVHPGQHHILALRATPSEDNPPELPLTLQLNADPKHTQELSVVSLVEKPRVCLEGDGSLFFKPTAVDSCSQRLYRIRNFSRLPLQFKWMISGSDQQVISVKPDSGVLQPNESSVQMWSFTPMEEMGYSLKPSLTFWPAQMPDCRKCRLPLKIIGTASEGSIQVENRVLELGEVLVGGYRSFEIPLVNNGTCAVSFSLSVKQNQLDPGPAHNTSSVPALELDSEKGTIAARSRLLVRATVRPARRAQYSWTISYQILNSKGRVLAEPQAVCEVRGEAVFPVLEVSDMRSSGSAERLSKLQLWSLFSLDALNAHLSRDPAPSELTYRLPTRHSLRRCPSVFTTAMLDLNFGAAPLGSDPSCMLLMFENTGSIPVDWSFLFPEDQQIELEYWADTVEFSPSELHQMKVQDNRLFSVSPRTGRLLPGQQKAVQFSYRHDFAGTDRLPVLFKLSHGREILLNFLGVTVERDRHYLHFTSSKHVFSPVAIGSFSPPIQVYELYNGGAVSARYQLDTKPLEKLTAENFDHLVLQCLNPQGEVLPGGSAQIEWVFSPLEAKAYSVDIPIHVLNGDSVLMTFEGCGVDKQLLGDSVPLQLHETYPSVPSTQRVPLPGQVVFLSEERVSLGDVPVCTRSTRILFLTNVSRVDTVYYSWNLADQQAVQIQPDCGTLAPEESVLCILTLQTSCSPKFYQIDLNCEVTLEEEVLRYQHALQQWEEEKERQKNEFTLTEKDLQDQGQRHTHSNLQEGEQAPLRSGPAVRKYKTLPPIRASTSSYLVGVPCARPTRAERRAQREAASAWRRPEPPQAALIHLGVTARSHSLLEFQTFFPSLLHTHHVYRSFQPSAHLSVPSPSSVPSADLPPLIHGPEREVLTFILPAILRSLQDDPSFHQSLVNTVSEPVPYFIQIKNSSNPTASPSTTSTLDPTARLQGGAEQLQELPDPPPHHQLDVQKALRRFPKFSDLVEEVLLNTIQNLMTEAFRGELVLTACPRIIALPPVSARKNGSGFRRVFSQGVADAEQNREPKNPQAFSPVPHLPPSLSLLNNLLPPPTPQSPHTD